MKRKIIKNILEDVKQDALYCLEEIDIDGMIKRAVNSKEINNIVVETVRQKILETIETKVFDKIKKSDKIIDAWTDNKVQGFLRGLGVKQ